MDFRQREQRDREYEKVRLQFSYDFRELLKEYDVSYKDIAKILNVTVPKVRQMIQSDNITIKDLVTLAYALQGTIRILVILPRP